MRWIRPQLDAPQETIAEEQEEYCPLDRCVCDASGIRSREGRDLQHGRDRLPAE
jgi:hypothetical protein